LNSASTKLQKHRQQDSNTIDPSKLLFMAFVMAAAALPSTAAGVTTAAGFSEFEARPVDSEVETQPLLQEPRRVTKHYAAGDGEEGDAGKVCPVA
jgi:hypothetical protein